MLFKPTPIFATADAADGRYGHAKFFGKLRVASRGCSDFSDLLFFQLNVILSLASRAFAVPHRVGHIPGSGIPSKIFKMVIGTVAICMAAISFFWPRANKCLKNKAMDVARVIFVCLPEIHKAIFFWTGNGTFQNSAFDRQSLTIGMRNNTRNRSNLAKITDFIGIFKPNNWAPFFNHFQSPITKAPWKCVWRQHGIQVFGSYPSHTGELYAI